MVTKIGVVYYLLMNLVAFILYGMDKQKARRNKWRIPERTLLGVALVGGGLGAFAGMQLFRHKTKHGIFRIGVPLFLLIHMGLIIYIIVRF